MYDFFLLWLLGALGFLIFEMGNPGLFFFLSFSIGASIAALSTIVTSVFEYQIMLFLAMSVIAMYSLCKWVARSKNSREKSNVAALLGKKVLVVEDIHPYKPGAVKFDGSVWAAHAYHDDFVKGDIVVIQAVRGAHVVVVSVNI